MSFTISYNVTDHDGDSATGSIVVNVDDDTPTVSANAAVQLDDDALSGGNAGGTGTLTSSSGTVTELNKSIADLPLNGRLTIDCWSSTWPIAALSPSAMRRMQANHGIDDAFRQDWPVPPGSVQ